MFKSFATFSCLSSSLSSFLFFFFNDPATTEIYTLSLHDALPIFTYDLRMAEAAALLGIPVRAPGSRSTRRAVSRSEEHTSELQSRQYLVCRLLLEKKKKKKQKNKHKQK